VTHHRVKRTKKPNSNDRQERKERKYNKKKWWRILSGWREPINGKNILYTSIRLPRLFFFFFFFLFIFCLSFPPCWLSQFWARGQNENK
jgi:hypothetical protein